MLIMRITFFLFKESAVLIKLGGILLLILSLERVLLSSFTRPSGLMPSLPEGDFIFRAFLPREVAIVWTIALYIGYLWALIVYHRDLEKRPY
jgi:hypothetical protein